MKRNRNSVRLYVWGWLIIFMIIQTTSCITKKKVEGFYSGGYDSNGIYLTLNDSTAIIKQGLHKLQYSIVDTIKWSYSNHYVHIDTVNFIINAKDTFRTHLTFYYRKSRLLLQIDTNTVLLEKPEVMSFRKAFYGPITGEDRETIEKIFGDSITIKSRMKDLKIITL